MADFRLSQTGTEVQSLLNQIPDMATAIAGKYTKPSGGIPDSDLTAAIQQALEKALSAYQKPSGGIPDTDMTQAVRNLLAAANTAYQKPGSGIPKTDLATAVQNLLDLAGTAYQKPASGIPLADMAASVQAAINASAGMQEAINNLQSTVTNHVGNSNIHVTSQDKTRWDAKPSAIEVEHAIEQAVTGLATTSEVTQAIATALIPYSTTEEEAQALAAALASYYTKTEVDTKMERVQFLERALGKYDATRNITLQQATAGKYVNVNGQEVSASGYGISTEVQLNAGDIMLVPSASAVPADVSLFARIVTRTYDKVITYAYAYRQDYPELPATATADYNPALIYTAQYNESGDTPVLTGWLMGGQTYTTLPATREVTESYYEPLMKQAVAAMPSTGYYVYLCPTAMTIVVSGYTATVNGGVALVVGLGIFKNIATNFIGAPGQAVLAQAFAQIFGEIDGLKAQLDNLGETRAVCINSEDMPKVQNYPMIIYGSGAPAAPNVPAFIGQKYLDTTNKKEYTAFSVTNSVSDWVLVN